MTLEDVKIKIQSFFDENTLTIVGSGLSAAEGIPGMAALADELCEKIPRQITESALLSEWMAIEKTIKTGIGLESALLHQPPKQELEYLIKHVTSQFIRDAEFKALRATITGKSQLRFSDYLSHFNIHSSGLTVITTNYDRLIEYACEYMGLRIDTLFVGRYISHFAPDESKYVHCKNIRRSKGGNSKVEFAPNVKIYKPHGCLSWHTIGGMPFSLPQVCDNDCLIITPGLNKFRAGYDPPFDTHREYANKAIDNALKYIIIGYGFNDDHLETHLNEQLRRKQSLIITHTLSKNAYNICKNCSQALALTHFEENGTSGTKVITSTLEEFFPNVNLWDIRSMVQEAFE